MEFFENIETFEITKVVKDGIAAGLEAIVLKNVESCEKFSLPKFTLFEFPFLGAISALATYEVSLSTSFLRLMNDSPSSSYFKT